MGDIRDQIKYCDFRCWYAKHKYCNCWCGGMNHGKMRTPDGFDPKRGLSEEEYEGLVTIDHAPTDKELHEHARSRNVHNRSHH